MPENLSGSNVAERPRWSSSIPIYLAVQKIIENAEEQLVEIFNVRENELLYELSNSQQECTVLAQENSRLRNLLGESASAPAPLPPCAKSSQLPELMEKPNANSTSEFICLPSPFKKIREPKDEDPVVETKSIAANPFQFAFQHEYFPFCSPLPPPKYDNAETKPEEFVIKRVTTTPSFGKSCSDEDDILSFINHDKGDKIHESIVTTQSCPDGDHKLETGTETWMHLEKVGHSGIANHLKGAGPSEIGEYPNK